MVRLLRWGGCALALAGALTMALADPAPAGAGEVSGRAVFERECQACHSVARGRNHVGPSLFAVIGRPAGSISSFSYSLALRASGLVWSAVTLDAFLANPQAAVPGTAMRFSGLGDAAERAAVIAYIVNP